LSDTCLHLSPRLNVEQPKGVAGRLLPEKFTFPVNNIKSAVYCHFTTASSAATFRSTEEGVRVCIDCSGRGSAGADCICAAALTSRPFVQSTNKGNAFDPIAVQARAAPHVEEGLEDEEGGSLGGEVSTAHVPFSSKRPAETNLISPS
jgi:hypothetical protein